MWTNRFGNDAVSVLVYAAMCMIHFAFISFAWADPGIIKGVGWGRDTEKGVSAGGGSVQHEVQNFFVSI